MSNQNSDYDFLKDKGFLVTLAIAGFLIIGDCMKRNAVNGSLALRFASQVG
jgi:hypothetical protein